MGRVFRNAGLLVLLNGAIFFYPGSGSGSAQVRAVESEAARPETNVADALYRLSLRAAFVFVGTVETIDRGQGVVEVGLHVDQVIQGQPGSHYVLREWAGRWPPGLNRYRVGQRALFFLPPPGASGLSSPVDGSDGVVPVLGDVNQPDAVPLLDTRRLSARLQRNVGDPLADERGMTLGKAAQVIAQGRAAGARRPAAPGGENPLPIVRQNAPGAQVSGGVHGAH